MAQSRFYKINGAAYTDMIVAVTQKHLNKISVEMGYSPTFLKNLRRDNRVRIAVANQIEQMYGIPVTHFIMAEPVREEKNTIPASVVADELMERIRETIIAYFTEKKEGLE